MTVIERLRTATAPDHAMVDAAFGAHALDGPVAYAAFLIAHARALPAVEAVFSHRPDLPLWRERTSLLAADLGDLGQRMPEPLPFTLPDTADAALGALYVTEGSRLGGIMLARSVPHGLPSRYLAARHLPGEWRALLAAIEARATDEPDLQSGARETFALYTRAVTPPRSVPSG